MRKFFFLLLFPLVGLAQQGTYIGVIANTGFYQLYNHVDFNSPRTVVQPVAQDITKFYDYNLGIKLGFAKNNKRAINIDLTFNQYRQDYRRYAGVYGPPPLQELWENYFSRLHYGTISASYVLNIFRHRNAEFVYPCLYLMGGVHASYLFNFYEYMINDIKTSTLIININDNGHATHSILNHKTGDVYSYNTETESIYNKLIYGINAGIGIKNNLTKNLDYAFEITGIYDIRNVDNLNAKATFNGNSNIVYWQGGSKLHNSFEYSVRPPSHNIYAGFGFSLFYYLGSGYYYK